MNIPQEFDTIRPWEPEDLPEVFDRLLSNDQFKQVLAYLYPQVPFEMIAQKLKACKTNLDFQLAFAYDFVHGILKKAATGCEMDCTSLDNTRNYTFISNHRAIVVIFLGFPERLSEQFHLTFCSHLFLLILFCHGYDVFVIIAYSQEPQVPWSRLWI